MLVTTCPTCHAKFRVSQQHLSAAEGLVVCSRCHGIFQAKDSLQQVEVADKKNAATANNSVSPNIKSGRATSQAKENNQEAKTQSAKTSSSEAVKNNKTKPKTAGNKQPFKLSTFFKQLIAPKNKTNTQSKSASKDKSVAKPAVDSAKKASPQVEAQKTNVAENKTTPTSKPIPKEESVKSQVKQQKVQTNAAKAQITQENNSSPKVDEKITAKVAEQNNNQATQTGQAPEFSAVNDAIAKSQVTAIENKMPEQQTGFYPPSMPNGQMPMQNPYWHPSMYQQQPMPQPPQKEEFNWMAASLAALIVLVIQLFYIILQK